MPMPALAALPLWRFHKYLNKELPDAEKQSVVYKNMCI